jgi:glucose-6-phosphate isomerase
MRASVEDLQSFAESLVRDGFRDAVVLGMGGSSLAPEVIARSIADSERSSSALRLHVLDTTDPAAIAAVRDQVDLERTMFLVASKSGTTIEASCLFEYFYDLVSKLAVGVPGENFIAITDEGSPLLALATERRFRRTFLNPADIGGRYSALSYFGLVPAAISGVNIGRLLDAASAAADDAKSPSGDALLLGVALGVLAEQARDKCTFLISPKIESFGLWVEQLIAESTGKDRRGIIPIVGEPALDAGEYGADRCFVRVRLRGHGEDSLDALAAALPDHGHPSITIDLDDAYALAGEFFRWEFAVAIAGHVLGINPFDEPNVQESKNNTGAALERLEVTGDVSLDAYSVDSPRFAAALRGLVDSLTDGDYFAILSYLSSSQSAGDAFNAMRKSIAKACGVATTLGVGPRYLHSTGQLHKGGPAVGAFLHLVESVARGAEGTPDIAVPGRPYTFGQLRQAQAAGDRQALIERGLRVITVQLPDGEESLSMVRVAVDTAAHSFGDGG